MATCLWVTCVPALVVKAQILFLILLEGVGGEKSNLSFKWSEAMHLLNLPWLLLLATRAPCCARVLALHTYIYLECLCLGCVL